MSREFYFLASTSGAFMLWFVIYYVKCGAFAHHLKAYLKRKGKWEDE